MPRPLSTDTGKNFIDGFMIVKIELLPLLVIMDFP